jgi:tetratricopeptide (TPR) repeat protein
VLVKFWLLVLALALALALALPITNAHAEDRTRAIAAFKEGSQHYNLGEFPQALESFREAYRNFNDPSFLFNIAQCERQLGHKREAVRAYRAFLHNAPENADDREQIKQIVAQLEREIDDEQNTAKMPPTTVTEPRGETATGATNGAVLTQSAAPPPPRKPAYKKWWVWTIVGGVVVAGAAAGVAVALTRTTTPTAMTTLGTQSPF